MTTPQQYDTASTIVFFIGLLEGVVPFVAKAIDWTPVWALPRHLDAPAWWIVSGLIVIVCFALLLWLDAAKKRLPA